MSKQTENDVVNCTTDTDSELQEVHREKDLQKCVVWHKEFKHRQSVYKHNKLHKSNYTRHQCSKCSKTFCRDDALVRHSQSVHSFSLSQSGY